MVAAIPPHHHPHHPNTLHHHTTLIRHILEHGPNPSHHHHHPIQLLQSIIGRTGGPLFGGAMGSYEDLLELAERLGPGRSLGLPDDAIDAIPVRTYNKEESTPGKLNCVICMMDYEDGDNIKTLSCTHEFHTSCITPWLKQRRTCPICRNELIPPTTSS